MKREYGALVATALLTLVAHPPSPARAQISYTFPDADAHLMSTLSTYPYNMSNIDDQQFVITNDSGKFWVGFRLWLEAHDYLGYDFCCAALSDYNGGGFPVFSNTNGDPYGLTERMGVWLLGIPDGGVYQFTVDMNFFPPEGCTDSEIWGDPIVLEFVRIVTTTIPWPLGHWDSDAMMVAGLPVTLVNETGATWSEFHLRLAAKDAAGEHFPFARFQDTDQSGTAYEGPGDPVFLNPDGIAGPEELHIRDLAVPAGEALNFQLDWTCFPPLGMDSLVVIGQAFTDLTAVPEEDLVAAQLSLHCDPNPFNPETAIKFFMIAASDASLDVYDPRGRRVRELVAGRLAAGDHSIVWDGRDDSGRVMASGVYVAHLRAGAVETAATMVLLK